MNQKQSKVVQSTDLIFLEADYFYTDSFKMIF